MRIAIQKQGFIISRRRIARIMKTLGLVSKYTLANFKIYKDKSNDSSVTNELQRKFTPGTNRNVLVADLTYVRVNQQWHYLCIIITLATREIVGYSVGKNKTAELVIKPSVKFP